MIINSKTYDILATIQRILTPLATFIVALCSIWGWTNHVEQIVATISALSVLLAALLKVCSDKYFSTGSIIFPNPELHVGEEEGEDE